MLIGQKIHDVQATLKSKDIDGWLLYDFRRLNDLACAFLEIPESTLLTRRTFYWIPAAGEPSKIVSAIESKALEHLPGNLRSYRTWKELESALAELLKGCQRIAMEYSPRNAVPYVSKVDAGTMELVRSLVPDVVSSADTLQKYTSVWDEEKLSLHLQAASSVSEIVEIAWNWIADQLSANKQLTEYDVQQLIKEEFKRRGCVHEGDPICAVNVNSSDPHYSPNKNNASPIQKGDFILIDLWCKKNKPRATYADITRVGVAAEKPTMRQQEIFSIVKEARDLALNLVKERFSQNIPLLGWEADQACRNAISSKGYGDYFIHRTGHNIDESDHGCGAHLDNYETQENREILPGTCFSIEPGIYLPGEFGVRLEYDVYVHHDGAVQVTGGEQTEITCLL